MSARLLLVWILLGILWLSPEVAFAQRGSTPGLWYCVQIAQSPYYGPAPCDADQPYWGRSADEAVALAQNQLIGHCMGEDAYPYAIAANWPETLPRFSANATVSWKPNAGTYTYDAYNLTDNACTDARVGLLNKTMIYCVGVPNTPCLLPPPPSPAPKNDGECNSDDAPSNNGSNPINAATGNKFQRELDYVGAGSSRLEFARYYNSRTHYDGALGQHWRHTFDRRIELKDANTVVAHRADGKQFEFLLSSGSWRSDPEVKLRLVEIGADWYLTDDADFTEHYDAGGKLLSLTPRGGLGTVLSYDGLGRLVTVNDGYGRQMSFAYANGRITTMTDPAGGLYQFTYDGVGNLVEVAYPDGTSRAYEYSALDFPHALTAITDASGTIAGRWEYDAEGRANAYEMAGGVRRMEFIYSEDGTTTVNDARGGTRTFTFADLNGSLRTQTVSGDPCTTCGGVQTQEFSHDANGYIASKIDLSGNETRYTRDSRGLELTRIEAYGTTEQRIITTEWHATFHVPVKITQGNLETSYTYDADGRQLTETVLDLATQESRTSSFAYRTDGLMESTTDARGNVTTYGYDTAGNLASVTNALGHVTGFGNYDAHGNPGAATDANGVTTTMVYDARQRLTERATQGHVTHLLYDAAGRLSKLTMPTGAFIEYEYDSAGRMTALEDIVGNRVEYVLDVTGNRIEERVKGSDGVAVREMFQTFDTLNRLIGTQGGNGQTTTFGRDAVGNLTAATDALGRVTTSHYDALNRVFEQIDALQGKTEYHYDVLDRLVTLSDPRGVTTQYTYNAFGDVLSVQSPDAGTSVFEYDSAGNRTRQTDARGVVTEYDYDALNRLTKIRYPTDPTKDITYIWDAGQFGVGRVHRIDDETGSTVYEYDAHGRVVGRVATILGTTLPLLQEFDENGNLTSLMHPHGHEITYSRGTSDRVTAVTLIEPDGTSVPIASGIEWAPFGGVTEMTFGNGLAHNRTYDLSGRVSTLTISGIQELTYEWNTVDNITAILSGTLNTASQSYGYDALDRLVSADSSAYGTLSYGYDAVGNRLHATDEGMQTTYGYDANSNRLHSVGGVWFTYDAAGNTLSDGQNQYAYDVKNRMTSANGFAYGYNALGQRAFKPNLVIGGGITDPGSCPDGQICPPPPGDDPAPSSLMTSGSVGVTYEQVGWILFHYDEAGRLIGEYDEQGNLIRQYIWLDDMPLAVLDASGLQFIHANHLNTPHTITNGTAQMVWVSGLRPFGDGETSPVPLRFSGQYHDDETGLNQNWHREYASRLGRYTQSDPIGLSGGLNTFAYAELSPIHNIDSTGLISEAMQRYFACVVTPNAVGCGSQYKEDLIRESAAAVPPAAASAADTAVQCGKCVTVCAVESYIGSDLSDLVQRGVNRYAQRRAHQTLTAIATTVGNRTMRRVARNAVPGYSVIQMGGDTINAIECSVECF